MDFSGAKRAGPTGVDIEGGMDIRLVDIRVGGLYSLRTSSKKMHIPEGRERVVSADLPKCFCRTVTSIFYEIYYTKPFLCANLFARRLHHFF